MIGRRGLWTIGSALAALLPPLSQAQVSVASPNFSYLQNFDSLATSGSTVAWSNNVTLPGWSLFDFNKSPISSYAAGDGSSNAGAFYSFGAAGSTQRAFGGLASGGAYFGSPAAGSTAGYMAVAFANNSGRSINGFNLAFDGEQWRNGGNTSAQTMVLEYGYGTGFASVTSWTAPGGRFDWTSPIVGATAAAIDGTGAGWVAGRGGNVTTSWAVGQTLWIRWVDNNDLGNDHALAIDNFSLTVSAVPEPSAWLLTLLGLTATGVVVAQRRDNSAR